MGSGEGFFFKSYDIIASVPADEDSVERTSLNRNEGLNSSSQVMEWNKGNPLTGMAIRQQMWAQALGHWQIW